MAQTPAGLPIGSLDSAQLIGAGGWSTRLIAFDDGTMVTGSDGSPPRIRSATDTFWTPLFRPGDNIDLSTATYTVYEQATWDVAGCDADSNHIYWVIIPYLYRTHDRGVTVTKSALDLTSGLSGTDGNDAARMTGKMLAVDPANHSVVWLGLQDGLHISTDGCDTMSNVSTATIPPPGTASNLSFTNGAVAITAGQTITGATSGATAVALVDAVLSSGAWDGTGVGYVPSCLTSGTFTTGENLQVGGVTHAKESAYSAVFQGRMSIAFDRTSAVSGGKTQGVYVFVNGHGLYHSTNAGSTFSAVAGSPLFASHMEIGPDGFVHLSGAGMASIPAANYAIVAETDGQYNRWNGSSWTTPSGVFGKSIAISPYVVGDVYLFNAGGALQFSSNNGTSFGAVTTSNVRLPTDIPWLAWTNELYMSNGNTQFNRVNNEIWFTEGIGAWKLDTAAVRNPSVPNWIEQSKGIETVSGFQLKTHWADGDVIWAGYDRQGFYIPRAQAGIIFPSTHFFNPNFCHGMDADWAFDNPNFVVSVVQSAGSRNGYSTDKGQTWNAYPTDMTAQPGAVGIGGGNIVALSTLVQLWLETDSGHLWRTPDRGNTWTICNVGPGMGFYPYYLSVRTLVKDNYTAGIAYYYNTGLLSDFLQGAALNSTQQQITNFNGISNGSVRITVDGGAAADVTGINLTTSATLADVAYHISVALVPFGAACNWDNANKWFTFTSSTYHATSQIGFLTTPGSGTNLAPLLLCRSADGATLQPGCVGVWKTTDYGATFSRIMKGLIGTNGDAGCNGKLYQLGQNDWAWARFDNNTGMWRSSDGMVTWAQATGSDNITGAGSWGEVFGVAATPGLTSGSKVYWACGNRNSIAHPATYSNWGYWMSIDNMANWTRVGQFPGGYMGTLTDLAGDALGFGTLYSMRGGEGAAKLTLVDRRLQS